MGQGSMDWMDMKWVESDERSGIDVIQGKPSLVPWTPTPHTNLIARHVEPLNLSIDYH